MHGQKNIKLVDIVTAGSQKITLWGPQRTPLGILRVNHHQFIRQYTELYSYDRYIIQYSRSMFVKYSIRQVTENHEHMYSLHIFESDFHRNGSRKVSLSLLFCTVRGNVNESKASCPLIPKFVGSNPAEAVGFLKVDKKILSTPSFGREVKLSVLCRRFAACKRTLGAYPRHHLATISRP